MPDLFKPTALAATNARDDNLDGACPHNDHGAVDLFLIAAMTGYSATRVPLDAPHPPTCRQGEPEQPHTTIAHGSWRAHHPQETRGRSAQ